MDRDSDTPSSLAAVQAELAEANRKVLLDEQLIEALRSFEQIMGYRNEMYLRLSGRVRQTVRGGMAVFGLVGIAMFLLLITLVMQVNHARTSSAMLAQHVSTVAANMVRVESTVLDMEQRMQRFATIAGNMRVMTGQTGSIAGGMQTLDDSMAVIHTQMQSINQRFDRINRHMGAMGHAVNGMGYSIHDMSRPAGMFP